MELKLQQIGNSVGVILPKEELTKRGYELGDTIEIEFSEDPFWNEIKKHSRKDRKKAYKADGLSADDFKEWKDL